MSRQAYFYRVPPQELHRRTQLQPEPAKTKALQTVIEMKVWSLHVSLCVAFTAWSRVLAMAGMELIFPGAACLVLCFEFQTETVLVTCWCFSCCPTGLTQRQSFPSFSLCSHPASRVGVDKRLGGSTAGTADPNSPEGYSIPSCHALQTEGRTFRVMAFVFPNNSCAWCSPTLLKTARHLGMGSSAWIPYCALLACTALLYILRCHVMGFPTSALWFSCLSLWGGVNEQLWHSAAYQGWFMPV